MLKFRKININDKKWIKELLVKSDFMACEYSFANNMAWVRLNDSQICRYKDFYIVGAVRDGLARFSFPAGEGDYFDVINQLRAYSKSMGATTEINYVSNNKVQLFNELFPNEFTIKKSEDSSDYIYNASDIIELKGKKYNKKRNHLAKFQQYSWEFSPMTVKDFDECIEFSAVAYNSKNGENSYSSVAEQYAIHTYFKYFKELELKGGVIRVDGKIVAFTLGERLNSNTFCVHIEKANTEYLGVYVAINNEFAKYAAKDFKYINREEDLGIEGLRKSKRSYYPAFLLEKNAIKFNK